MDDILDLLDRNAKIESDEGWSVENKEDRDLILMIEMRAVELIGEILNGNKELCQRISEKVIRRCCDFLIDILPGDEMRYLRCLQVIVVHSQSNQTKKKCIQIMMDKLLDRENHFVLSDAPTEDNRTYFTRLTSLFAYGISTDRTWGEFQQHDDDDFDENDPDKSTLLSLIVRLQGALNIDWLLEEIEHLHKDNWDDLEGAYLRLLNALYLHHTHLHTSVIENYAKLVRTIERLMKEVSSWMSLQVHGPTGYKKPPNMDNLTERLQYSVLPTIYAFFRYVLPRAPMGGGSSIDKFVEGLKVWVCGLTRRPINHPVLASDGHTYEKRYIEEWLGNEANGALSPETKVKMDEKVKDHALLKQVMDEKGDEARAFAAMIVGMRSDKIAEYEEFIKRVDGSGDGNSKRENAEKSSNGWLCCFNKKGSTNDPSEIVGDASEKTPSKLENKKIKLQKGNIYTAGTLRHFASSPQVHASDGELAEVAKTGVHDAVNSAMGGLGVTQFFQKKKPQMQRQMTMVIDRQRRDSVRLMGADNDAGNKFEEILVNSDRYFELLTSLIKKSEQVLQVSGNQVNELNRDRAKVKLGTLNSAEKVTLEKFFVFELQKMERGQDPKWISKNSVTLNKVRNKAMKGLDTVKSHSNILRLENLHDFATEVGYLKNGIDYKLHMERLKIAEQSLHKFSKIAAKGVGESLEGAREVVTGKSKKTKIDPLYPKFEALVTKMIRHVTQNLLIEIHSGFDTRHINRRIMLTLTAFMKDQKSISDHSRGVFKQRAKEEFERCQSLLAKCGALSLVIQVISHADDEDSDTLQAALELGILMLMYGNKDCQDEIKRHFKQLSHRNGHKFFYEVHEHIRDLHTYISSNPDVVMTFGREEKKAWIVEKQAMLLRFLQLWAEGHNEDMQELLREQKFRKSFNIIADVIKSFDKLTQNAEAFVQSHPDSLEIIEQHFEFLTECLQGPCEKNQDFVINETRLALFIKRYMNVVHELMEHMQRKDDKDNEDSEDMKAMQVQRRHKLYKGLVLSCRLLGAMIEGRGDAKNIHLEVGEQLSTTIFKRHLVLMKHTEIELEKEEKIAGSVEEQKEISELKHELEASSYDLYSVYEQVGASLPKMKEEIQVHEGSAKAEDEKYAKAYSDLKTRVCRIEFMWNNRVDVLYFPKPIEAVSLSRASKRELEENVNMDTTESKQRDFLTHAKRLVDEMRLLHASREYPYVGRLFGFVEKNVITIRFVAFAFSVMVNFVLALIVVGPGGDGYPYEAARKVTPYRQYGDDWGYVSRPRRIFTGIFRRISFYPEDVVYILLVIISVAYLIIGSFTCFVKAMLIFKEKTREHDEARKHQNQRYDDDQDEVDSEKKWHWTLAWAWDCLKPTLRWLKLSTKSDRDNAWKDTMRMLPAFLPVVLTAVVVGAILFVVEVTDVTYREGKAYDDESIDNLYAWRRAFYGFGFALITAAIVPTIQKVLLKKKIQAWRDRVFLTFYDLLFDTEVTVPLANFFLAVRGHRNFYFASLLLVDIVFINTSLKNVMKAVTTNALDIVMTLLLMFAVVFIFASFGIWQFGRYVQFQGEDDVTIKDNEADVEGTLFECPNLAICFLHFLDQGLRSGDIVGAAFVDMTWNHPGMSAWIGRIVYAFSFFFVVGVILFNIVAGIIIDAFGGLREKAQERQQNIRTFSFIAGIERSNYEENSWDFNQLDNEEQNKWNYVYFLLHLKQKDEDEYTGAESSINDRINSGDLGWLPDRKSWKLQLHLGTESTLAEEDMPQDILKIRKRLDDSIEKINAVSTKIASLDENVGKLHAVLDDGKNGSKRSDSAKAGGGINKIKSGHWS